MGLKKLIREELERINGSPLKCVKLYFSEHHLSHAASAFYPSPFNEAAILTIDGVGEWATASIGYGRDSTVIILREMHFPHSVGLLYSAFTYYLGFKVNSGEYKLMGLAPYGDPYSERTRLFREIILREFVDAKEDGSIFLNQEYFHYATGLTMVNEDKWERLFGFPRRLPESEIEQHHCDLAFAIQGITEDIVFRMAKTAKDLTGSGFLCLAGGVALNCVANGKLLRSRLFNDIWIQPAASDAGGALGAAYAVYHMGLGYERRNGADKMQGAFLGPAFSDHDILAVAKKYRAPYILIVNDEELFRYVAQRLVEGKTVGWFQGRMEWGPRALGNRSILGDPRNADMQKHMNVRIKYRESFRPFAPSVLAEYAAEYFDIDRASPYMLLTVPVRNERRRHLPDDYHKRSIREKLYWVRSDIPAVTHLDYSARVQTVHRETNPRFWALIRAFKDMTGYALLVNTSFNVRGEPIVCTPEDAYRCFMRTDLDVLVMNNFVFEKKDQPPWSEGKEWKKDLILD